MEITIQFSTVKNGKEQNGGQTNENIKNKVNNTYIERFYLW